MSLKAVEKIDRDNMNKKVEPFSIGDALDVHVKIHEGDKERVQVFKGTVIARDGAGATATFTVRRVSHGVGVERVFPLHSPNLVKIEVTGSGHVRRAKLYFLRDRVGKKAKLRGKIRKKVAVKTPGADEVPQPIEPVVQAEETPSSEQGE